MKDAIINLLKTDSLMTILLTLVFCAGCIIQQITGQAIPQSLENVYMVVVTFYFGYKTGKAIQSVRDEAMAYEEEDDEV